MSMLPFLAAVLATPAEARTLVVGIDLSGSSAIVRDDVFAGRVAAVLAEKIADLGFRDVVRVRTLGEYETRKNPDTTAKRGRSRNPRPPLLKSVVNRDRYMRDFMDGYAEGYGTGCKDAMRAGKPSFAR